MKYIQQEFESFDSTKQKLLCLIAYNGTKTSYHTLQNFARKNNLHIDKVKELVMDMAHKNMCTTRLFYDSYSITSTFFLPALRFLIIEHEEWIDEIKGYKTQNDTWFIQIRNNTFALLKNKIAPKKQIDIKNESYNIISYLTPIVLYPDLIPLVDMIPPTYMEMYFNRVINMLFMADITDKYDNVERILDSSKNISPACKKEIKEALALYRYYAFGEYAPKGTGNSLFDCILRGVYSLHKREYKEAGAMLDKALKLRNKESNLKNVFMNVMTCYFLICYYIKDASPASTKKIQQFINKSKVFETDSLLPAYIVGNWHVDPTHQVNIMSLFKLHMISMNNQLCILKVFANCLSTAFNLTIPADYKKNYIPKHAILQHEFQLFIPIDKNISKNLNNTFGKPLLFSEKLPEPWEIILDDLIKESLEDKTTQKKEDDKRKRIAYILKGNSIGVREQTAKKDGGWYSGKEISSSRYSEGNLESMDETDRVIWRVNHGSCFFMNLENVLPYLVGTDKVLTGYHSPFLPVTIDEEKLCLMINKNEDGFSVISNLPELENQNVYVKKINETRYVVIRINETEKKICNRLLELEKLPLEAEKKLKEVLPLIASKVHIESSLMYDDGTLGLQESLNQIVLRVKSINSQSFNVCLFAKSDPKMTGLYEPGNGQNIVIDKDMDGGLVKVKRDLDKELENLKNLNIFLETFRSGKNDLFGYTSQPKRTNWNLELDEMLNVIEYVNNHSKTYAIEWPEGEKIRIKKINQSKQWNVNLHQESGWFNMEGEVEIDKNTIIGIGKLLQLNELAEHTNYIRLNDTDYIVLTRAIRKQLAQLEALSIQKNGGVRIPVTNALALNEILDEEFPINKGEDLKLLLKKIKDSDNLNPTIPGNLQATLRRYQKEGFRWILQLDSWGAGACLADDMGLGKTIQTIAVLLDKANYGPSLIVAPTSVICNWKNEIERFAPSLNTVLINELDSDKRMEAVDKVGSSDVILTTYGILCSEKNLLKRKEWNVVCLDEAHTIKNRETKTAQAVYELNGRTRIALTGTPLQNHVGELWSLFNFINPGMLCSYDSFRRKFLLPIENGNKDRQHLLRRIVLPFILRRTKNEVIKELPEKSEIKYLVNLSKEEMHAYELLRTKAQKQLDKEKKVSVNVLSEITKLRQAACASKLVDKKLDFASSKLEQMMELVNEIHEGGNRVLIFSQFTSFLKMIKNRLDKEKLEYLYLDGTIHMKERTEMVRRFQNGESCIFLISLKAGGLGLNLTGANYVIHMDPWWNPAIEQQATDRTYRIGQEQKVTVYHLIAAHTIEEKILRLHQTKRDLADSLLEGADVSHKLTEDDLRELLS